MRSDSTSWIFVPNRSPRARLESHEDEDVSRLQLGAKYETLLGRVRELALDVEAVLGEAPDALGLTLPGFGLLVREPQEIGVDLRLDTEPGPYDAVTFVRMAPDAIGELRARSRDRLRSESCWGRWSELALPPKGCHSCIDFDRNDRRRSPTLQELLRHSRLGSRLETAKAPLGETYDTTRSMGFVETRERASDHHGRTA